MFSIYRILGRFSCFRFFRLFTYFVVLFLFPYLLPKHLQYHWHQCQMSLQSEEYLWVLEEYPPRKENRLQMQYRERSGSVVECLTRDQWVAGSSLTSVTVLCIWARHISPCLVLGSTQEDPSWHNRKIVNWDVMNQIKQTNKCNTMGESWKFANSFKVYKLKIKKCGIMLTKNNF